LLVDSQSDLAPTQEAHDRVTSKSPVLSLNDLTNMLLMRIILCLTTALLLTAVSAELSLYNSTVLANATKLSPRCIEAMSNNINCDPILLRFASVGYGGDMDSTFLSDTLCYPACVSSLEAYRGKVAQDCSTVDAWPGVPATYNGDFVQAYQN
jgi:hypothetical protein